MQETPLRPTRVLRYTLGPADRLAFAMLRHELTGWEKLRLLVILGVAGLLAGMLPEDMGAMAWWAAVALILGFGAATAILWSNLEIRRKAAALNVPKGAVETEEWVDRLVVRSQAGTQDLAYELIGQVIITDAHVFILYDRGPTIVPLRAFEDLQAMRAFGEAIDRRSEEAAA
jgi:hypothetical protein